MLRRAAARGAGALGVGGAALWAGLTTVNDEWDDVLPLRAPVNPQRRERVVVLGSGWGALEVVRKLAPEQDCIVISPRPHFTYTPLLAGSAVGTVQTSHVVEPIRPFLMRRASTNKAGGHRRTYVQAVCEDVDFERRVVVARPLVEDYNALERAGEDGEVEMASFEVPYDQLVVAVGATTATFGIPGVSEHALFLKEVSDAAAVRQRLLNCLERASSLLAEAEEMSAAAGAGKAPAAVAAAARDVKTRKQDKGRPMDPAALTREADKLLHFVVVGGGPTGVELSAELADFVRTDVASKFGPELARRVRISLVEAMPKVLGPFDPALADFAVKHLTAQGVNVRVNTAVKKITGRHSATVAVGGQQESIEFGFIVWAAGIATRPLSLKLAERLGQYTPGKGVRPPRGIAVDERLRAKGAPAGAGGVYAIGDCALAGPPPTAQAAAQEGKYLGRVLRDMFLDGSDAAAAKPFQYDSKGAMAFIGDRSAIAQLPGAERPAMNYVWRNLHGAPQEAPAKDKAAANAKPPNQHMTGHTAFLFWRSVYFSKLLSGSNRTAIVGDWLRTEVFGRDVVQHSAPIMPRSFESG